MDVIFEFIQDNLVSIVDVGLAIFTVALFVSWLQRYVRLRYLMLILIFVVSARSIATTFRMSYLPSVIDLVTTGFLVWFFVVYQKELREAVNKQLGRKKRSQILFTSAEDNSLEQEKVIQILTTSVLAMSSARVGAILTIERNDNLDSFIQTGVMLDIPLKEEIINTIFYPGTPLHDGAVIVRNNLIKAASVYYTPTTKAMTGKYGARHRAALGISDMCDALTIVVSEETGRISFAVDGALELVSRDDFQKRLTDLMSDSGE